MGNVGSELARAPNPKARASTLTYMRSPSVPSVKSVVNRIGVFPAISVLRIRGFLIPCPYPMKNLLKVIAALSVAFLAFSLFASAGQSNVGKAVPPLKLEYVKNEVQVAGKPMILEFWATWCGPCRKSIPHLNEIYKKFKDRGLLAVGVTDEDRMTVEGFMVKTPMDYTVAIDADGALGNSFGIKGIPHAMLVDKSGKIVWEGHPMDLQESAIEALLK